MPELEHPYTVSRAEMELLEWLRVAHGPRFSIIIDVHDVGCGVKLLDAGAEGASVKTGAGKTFDDAWRELKPMGEPQAEDVPPTFSVIDGAPSLGLP